MKIRRRIVTILPKISFVLLSLILGASTVLAHRSPSGCSGSGLAIGLFTSTPQVHVGDIISYSVTVYNGSGSGPIVCDATNIQASLVTPDGQTHPISLIRTALSNGQLDDYSNVVTYTVRAEDVKADGTLTATASDSGTIHQNDVDSQGGGNQGLNVTVIVAAPSPSSSPIPSSTPSPSSSPSSSTNTITTTPSPTPPPTGGGGGGGGGGGVSLPPPLIHLVKSPSVLILPASGGKVTYTYSVTNIGTIALSNVNVVDDKCSPVSGHSGDINNNNLLDVSEMWVYTCLTNLIQTTTNIGTAQGLANGFTVTATSSTTVRVSAIGLPNTGISPQEKNIWNVALLAGALMVVLISLATVLRKSKI